MTVLAPTEVPLSREFRPHLKAKIQACPGWTDLSKRNGWDGRAHLMTAGEWRQAAHDLGFDLRAEYQAFLAQGGKPGIIDANAFIAIEPEKSDMTAKTDTEASDAIVEALAGFEGRDAQDVIDEALAPASAHLTPYLSNLLPGLLRPVVEAAVQGPRIVEREVIVPGSSSASTVARAPLPSVRVKRQETVGRTFGIARNIGGNDYKRVLDGLMLDLCECSDAPRVDPDFVWMPDMLAQMAVCDARRRNAWLVGPKGTGKTEGSMQYAARLGRPFVRIPLNHETDPQALIGQTLPETGDVWKWTDGALTRAFRIPHCVILIDEPTLLRSGTLAFLQTVLDTREIHLPTGEVVKAAPGVFVIAADNTAGTGDETGIYVDTAPINAATLDRFALRIEVGFLPVEKETQVLAKRSGLDADACRLIVDYGHLTRKSAASGKLTVGVTFRRLLAWAEAVACGMSSEAAFKSAVLTGSTSEDREALGMLGNDKVTRHADIDAFARGEKPVGFQASFEAEAMDPRQGSVGDTGLAYPKA